MGVMVLDRLSAQELGRHPLPAAALDHCSGLCSQLQSLLSPACLSQPFPPTAKSRLAAGTSRYLGAELGRRIGIIFASANMVAVAMHTAGSVETLSYLLWLPSGDTPLCTSQPRSHWLLWVPRKYFLRRYGATVA
ncbi:Solute carrier family 12 member 3 [Manis javanica]|nr:Solute carrier family 12 member 3 [Manis javanica]